MKHKLLLLYTWFVKVMCFFLPDQPNIMRLRGWLYSFAMEGCGYNFQVGHSAMLSSLENLSVGNDVYIAPNTTVLANGGLMIGDGVLIAPGCVISTSNHTIENGSFRFGEREEKPVFIGSGSWVAANCTIVAGAHLPKHSLLAANSCLSGQFTNDFYIYAGIPAKGIKKIECRD
jgi:maltose O-acetyltransferase